MVIISKCKFVSSELLELTSSDGSVSYRLVHLLVQKRSMKKILAFQYFSEKPKALNALTVANKLISTGRFVEVTFSLSFTVKLQSGENNYLDISKQVYVNGLDCIAQNSQNVYFSHYLTIVDVQNEKAVNGNAHLVSDSFLDD